MYSSFCCTYIFFMINLEQKFVGRKRIMKRIRILHCADLHFDTPFKELSEKLSFLSKEELLEVFNNIIEICKQKTVDILLLSGDIFDNYTVNKKTLFYLRKKIEEIKHIRVFIAPGNHDPYNEKSFYKIIQWPQNVYIFTREIESVVVEELNTVVWGAAFNKPHINKSLVKNVDALEDYINLMVIHGDIASAEDGNEYNPITLKNIRESKMDYVALGHRHGYSGILREGNTCYAYSGCPQGRGFDELGDKGIILGEVYKGGVDLSFIRTSKRNYYVHKIDVSNCYGYDEIKEKILKETIEEKRNKDFHKIILVGSVEAHLNLKEEIIFEKLKDDFYFVKVVDKTSVRIDFSSISKDYSLKGIFVRKLLDELERSDEDEKEVINMALKLGVQCLSEEEVKINDY